MMKNEDDGEVVCMTEEELRRLVQEQVEKDEQVVNRQTQMAQLDEWVKQRERQTVYNRLLYNNACESVLECESVIKGLYGMLGLEYRDTDSEEEGEVKQVKNAVQAAEHSDSADDDGADAEADDDYVVIDLGASVPEPEMKPKTLTEDPALKTSAAMEAKDLKAEDPSLGLLPIKKCEETSWPISDPSLKHLPAEGVAPRTENPASGSISRSKPGGNAPEMPSVSPRAASSTPPEKTPECPETSRIKTETVELPVDDSATSSNEAAPSKLPVLTHTASGSPAAVDKAKSANPKPNKKPSTSFGSSGKHTESEKSKGKNADPGPEGRKTRSRTAPEGEPSEKTTTETKQTDKPSTSSSAAAPRERTKSVNPEGGDKSANPSPAAPPPERGAASNGEKTKSSKETLSPSTFNVAKKTGSTDPKPAERPSGVGAAPKTTNPEKSSLTQTVRTQETVASATDKESKEGALVTSFVPTRIQEEIPLKEKMSILGRRRTKTWHKGTILDIRTTDGDPRYKVLFEGGKGKSMLSGHHLACVNPPLLKDLFVGCRVVANYKEDNQSWFHAAIIAEMPDRRNRMRFLVFFDDGSASYIALPDLHLVCKPLRNVCDDMEDPDWRKDMQEYLQAYPNPIFVVMRVGQESTVKREDKMEPCVVTQVDASLIQISYARDQVKEWLYKGSNRIEQIQRIKKRMAEDKKDQSVNKVGWIPNQRNLKPVTTTTAPIFLGTPNAVSSKSSAVNQTVPIVTSSSKTSANVSPVTSSSTSKPVSSVSTVAGLSTGATVSSVSTMSVPSAGPVVSSASTVAASSTGQKDPVVSTAAKAPYMAVVKSPMYQPKVMLNRITFPSSDEKSISAASLNHLESTDTTSSGGVKRPHSEQEDHSNQAVIPVMETRLKYIPHRCCPACLNQVRPMQKDKHRGKNPLLVPLLYGFRRMTARRRLDGKMSFHVFYRAPCGRSMCEMEEVQGFLFESRCDFLYLDMFSLDPFVLVKRAVLPSSMCSLRYFYLRDITHGKELVPVSCVNEIDSTPPPPLIYTRLRQNAAGVQINTNLDFMVGCDCTDGCRDRSKCACHQLTIEATSLFTDGPVDVSAGYTHKRLPKYVPTGVYECNPLCRCDPWLCGNRLVQHGLQLRLEVFMTQHKGWGIRCLDDIAKGTFVCDFTGKIVTDEMCTGGDASNNEYLANLDYIEGVEKLKEGYESEAFCSDAEPETDKKTLISMTTGALKKHGIFKPDSSSSDEEKELLQRAEMETTKTSVKRKRKADDSDFDDSEFEDDLDDEDYEMSMEGSAQLKLTSRDYQRSYTTRRNTKMDSPGEPKVSFAKKSTRAFAIKSSHRRVKPLDAVKKSEPETGVVPVRKSTRSLFNEEKGCYLIDAKQEGNLARYINHSCSPNLFVQNVFVDTHDLRFPWVSFFTSKRIRAGTELTWDYSYEVGSVEGKVLLCCCGSAECTGRLL